MRDGCRCPKHTDNDKRSKAKFKRGFGKLFVERNVNGDFDQWSRVNDPFFKVKGKTRHRMHV